MLRVVGRRRAHLLAARRIPMLTSRLFSEQLKGRWRLEVLLCGTTTCKELKPGHVGWRRLEVLFCTTPGMESSSKVHLARALDGFGGRLELGEVERQALEERRVPDSHNTPPPPPPPIVRERERERVSHALADEVSEPTSEERHGCDIAHEAAALLVHRRSIL